MKKKNNTKIYNFIQLEDLLITFKNYPNNRKYVCIYILQFISSKKYKYNSWK